MLSEGLAQSKYWYKFNISCSHYPLGMSFTASSRKCCFLVLSGQEFIFPTKQEIQREEFKAILLLSSSAILSWASTLCNVHSLANIDDSSCVLSRWNLRNCYHLQLFVCMGQDFSILATRNLTAKNEMLQPVQVCNCHP